jgi:translation initiation factor 3 subunit K
MSPQHIEELLKGGTRYDAHILPDLEAHLKEQLKTGSYDADANLAMLKLYLLSPDEMSIEVIEGILLKALMALPSTDFSLCMCMIPEKCQKEDSLKAIVNLAQQLEMAKFKTFWKEAESVESLAKAVGWQNAVRGFIAGVISATYRSIRSEQVTELLNLPAAELESMMKERGWSRSKEDKDVLIVNTASFESVRVEPKGPTNMSLDQYRKLHSAATTNL